MSHDTFPQKSAEKDKKREKTGDFIRRSVSRIYRIPRTASDLSDRKNPQEEQPTFCKPRKQAGKTVQKPDAHTDIIFAASAVSASTRPSTCRRE